MPRLRRVTMQNFRGSASHSHIDFGNKHLILVFGENGTGKSTIVDAIDLVCNEVYGTVDERSSATRKEHLPTVGTKPTQVEVQIEFDAGTWVGRLNNSGKAQVTGHSPKPVVRVLRRRSLLKLTEATPSDRYKQLASLIDIGPIGNAETQLAAAHKQVDARVTSLVGDVTRENERLKQLWELAGDSRHADPLQWARERVSHDQSGLREQIQVLSHQVGALQEVLRARQKQAEAQQKQRKAQQSLEELEQLSSHAAQALEASLTALLEQAQQHVQAHAQDLAACPVCEQPLSAPALLAALQERLNQSRAVQESNRHRRAAQQEVERASAELSVMQKQLTEAQLTFSALCTDPPTEATLSAWQAETQRLTTALENHQALTLIVRTLTETRAEAVQQQAVLSRLGAMLEKVRQTRLAYTQRIFDAVATDTQHLYAAIHPYEKLGLSRIELEPGKTASLQQRGYFHGHDDIAPQGFYSEAHLDTLGFCFWLAVVKHTSPGAIVVLDDVFTSVDASHLNRIDTLLLQEAKSGQLAQIVAITHYRGWLDKLKGELPEQDIEVKELGRWSLEHGLSVRGVVPDTSELKAKLQDSFLDRQGTASKAGVVLEAMLDHITATFRLSMPRQPMYTLDPLLSAVTSASKKWHTVQGKQPPQPWPPVLTRLNALAFIRNQVGAHFNVSGSDVTDDDIREFAEATLALADLLYCQSCGRRVYHKDENTHRSCGGECKQGTLYTKGLPGATP